MKIAVAFSGGGARCLAQLGYINALLEQGITLEAVSGSSGGAIVAAFLALGLTPKEILKHIKSFPFNKVKFNLLKGSLFTLEPLIDEVQKVGLKNFSECRIPLYVCITNYEDGKSSYIHQGDLSRAILASSALLPIFGPIEFEGKLYIDGGFSDNLPINPLKKYPFILAINVNPMHNNFKKTLWGNIKRASYILINSNIRSSLSNVSKYIEIAECTKFDILDRKHFDQIYTIGYNLAKSHQKEWEKECLKNS